MKQGWEIKKLGEICESDLGKTLNQSKDKGELYPYLCSINVLWDKFDFTVVKQARFDDKELERYTVRKGDLLICEGGDIGRAAIWNQDNPILYQNALHRVRLINNDVIPRFVMLFLKYLKLSGVLDTRYGKGVTIKHLVKSSLLSIPIPVPERAEQERIVGELDCLSRIIAAKRAQLRELDTLAQSIFYTMFGDPITNDKGWQTKTLGNVCVVNPPKKDTLADVQSDDFVSFIPMEDLSVKAGYVKSKQQRLCKDVQSSYTCFADNDILMAKVTPCFENGKVGITQNLVNGIGFGSSEFIVIRPVNVIKEYVYFVIQTPIFIDEAVKRLTGTSGLRRVPRTYVEECIISIPPIDLQQQFAEKIENIERQKELITKSIKETEDLFNSRMDYYFN